MDNNEITYYSTRDENDKITSYQENENGVRFVHPLDIPNQPIANYILEDTGSNAVYPFGRPIDLGIISFVRSKKPKLNLFGTDVYNIVKITRQASGGYSVSDDGGSVPFMTPMQAIRVAVNWIYAKDQGYEVRPLMTRSN